MKTGPLSTGREGRSKRSELGVSQKPQTSKPISDRLQRTFPGSKHATHQQRRDTQQQVKQGNTKSNRYG